MGKISVEDGLDILDKYKQKFSLQSNKELSVHLDIPYQTVASWYRRKRVPDVEKIKIAAQVDRAWTIDIDEIKADKVLNTYENIKAISSYSMIRKMEQYSYRLLLSEIMVELAIEFGRLFPLECKTKIGNMFSDMIEGSWWLQEMMFDAIFESKNGNILEILSNPKINETIAAQIDDLEDEAEITKIVIFLSTFFGKEKYQKIIKDICLLAITKEFCVTFYKKEFLPERIVEYICLLIIDTRKHSNTYKESCIDYEINYLTKNFKFFHSKEKVIEWALTQFIDRVWLLLEEIRKKFQQHGSIE